VWGGRGVGYVLGFASGLSWAGGLTTINEARL
jgi:hypothetical protein